MKNAIKIFEDRLSNLRQEQSNHSDKRSGLYAIDLVERGRDIATEIRTLVWVLKILDGKDRSINTTVRVMEVNK